MVCLLLEFKFWPKPPLVPVQEAGAWHPWGGQALLVPSCMGLQHWPARSPAATQPRAGTPVELPVSLAAVSRGAFHSIAISAGFSFILCHGVWITAAPGAGAVRLFNLPWGSRYLFGRAGLYLVSRGAHYWDNLGYISSLKDSLFQCGFLAHVLPI